MKTCENLPRGTTVPMRPGTRRWLKRMWWRRVRSAERVSPEDAPVRHNYRGWWD